MCVCVSVLSRALRNYPTSDCPFRDAWMPVAERHVERRPSAQNPWAVAEGGRFRGAPGPNLVG